MIQRKISILTLFVLLTSFSSYAFDSKFDRREVEGNENIKPKLIDSNRVEEVLELEVFLNDTIVKKKEHEIEGVKKKKLFGNKEVKGKGIPLEGNIAMLMGVVPNLIFILAIVTNFPVLVIVSGLATILVLLYAFKLINFYKNNKDYPNSRSERLKGWLAMLFASLWVWFVGIILLIFILMWGW